MSNMYTDFKTWNPFKGCRYDCLYCETSFKLQAKRQKQRCMDCYTYAPHTHEHQLSKVPSSAMIFACANGDVAFCDTEYLQRIVDEMAVRLGKLFLLQSKNPATFDRIKLYPTNVILGTTVETNNMAVYHGVSKAPNPEKRINDLARVLHDRKFITIEPVMPHDVEIMVAWVELVNPELVWIGAENHGNRIIRAASEDVWRLHDALIKKGFSVQKKSMPERNEGQLMSA